PGALPMITSRFGVWTVTSAINGLPMTTSLAAESSFTMRAPSRSTSNAPAAYEALLTADRAMPVATRNGQVDRNMLINPLFLNDLFIMFGHASSHGDSPPEHPQRSVNAAENRQIKGKKMVRSTTRLLGTVALCFAASGCALFADQTVKEPKTAD